MPHNPNTRALVAILVLFAATILPLPAQRSAVPSAPDSTLYITYSGGTTITWVVCGSTQQSEGCYSAGDLGPFITVGAMLEGNPSINGNVVTRAVYIVDIGDANNVQLYVYKRTDTVTSTYDTTTIALFRTVALPLTGGAAAECFMAANNGYLFIGTNQNSLAVEVSKKNLSQLQIGGIDPPLVTTSITSDQYGYVAVTTGTSGGVSVFTVFGPAGSSVEEGGGSDFMVGTTQAVQASTLLTGNATPVPRRGYHLKASSAPSDGN